MLKCVNAGSKDKRMGHKKEEDEMMEEKNWEEEGGGEEDDKIVSTGKRRERFQIHEVCQIEKTLIELRVWMMWKREN